MSGSRPLVRILQGQLRGVIERSINGKQYAAFKGIPYAKPPVGELRFRDPVPAEPWPHVMDTSKFGLSCAQLDPTTGKLVGSDDCLYLNVYAPSETSGKGSSLKPVMFWIHGGLFAHGSGDDTQFGPDYIVEKDVILVTINYRLNVFGFLNLEDDETTGNQGLKDQVLALKWVRENIEKFGGDPNNVTIFGVSSGGACVHYLTLSPLAKGLYHKAISQSGLAFNPWTVVQKSPKSCAQDLAAALGEKIGDSKILVEFFRSLDAHRLAEVDAKISSEMVRQSCRLFMPSVDDKSKRPLLPVPAEVAAEHGVDVPYMIGYTSHEAILHLVGLSVEKFKAVDADVRMVLSPKLRSILCNKGLTPAEVRSIYFGDKPISKETRSNFVQMKTDLLFTFGIHDFAEIQSRLPKRQTYLYKFTYDNGRSRIKSTYGLTDVPGACHTDEIPFLFHSKIMERLGIPPPKPGSTDHKVVQQLTQMWTDFAKTGNPTPAVTDTVPVIWSPVSNGQNLEYMNIGADLRMESMVNINKLHAKTSSKL